jgi:hypothetical protein
MRWSMNTFSTTPSSSCGLIMVSDSAISGSTFFPAKNFVCN